MPSKRTGWIVIFAAAFGLMFSAGMRSTFGVLIAPLDIEFGWGRATLGIVAAVGLALYGAVGPLAGRFADGWSSRRILTIGVVITGVASIAAAFAHSLVAIVLTIGVVSAIGSGFAGMPAATPLVNRWFAGKRGLIIGVLGAGMSAGQVLVIPLAAILVARIGWRPTLEILGGIALVVVAPLIATLVRDRPTEKTERSSVALAGLTVAQSVREPAFWLLCGSFFVCGYTSVGLILTHFIADCLDRGFSTYQASGALALMGGLNVVGTIASGWICDRYGRRIPLALFYGFRGLTLIVLIFVHEPIGLFAFAAAFGLNYIATVPPTSSLISRIFGGRSAGELYGWVFVAHQIGAALGASIGGILYAASHNYTSAYISAAVLAFVAAIAVLAIRDAPRFHPPLAESLASA